MSLFLQTCLVAKATGSACSYRCGGYRSTSKEKNPVVTDLLLGGYGLRVMGRVVIQHLTVFG